MKHTCIAIIITAMLLTACGSYTATSYNEKSPERQHVKIAYLPVTWALPFYLAIEKGYFVAEGIEVEPIKFDSPNLILNAIVSGQVDFGATSTATGIAAIADHANPGKLKIFAVGGSSTAVSDAINEGLIVAKDSTIVSISDLRGKKVGILPSIQWRTIARHIFAQNGLSEKDVTLVELAPGLHVQALQVGQVDALLTIEPMLTVAEKSGISRNLVDAPVETFVADPMFAGAGVVSLAFADKNPATTRKVLLVMNKAIAEVNADWDAARPYLRGYTPLNDDLINDVPRVFFKTASEMTAEDIEALQKFFDIFTQQKVIDGRVNASELIYKP